MLLPSLFLPLPPSGVTHAAVKPWKDSTGAYRLAGYVAPDTVDLPATDTFLRSKLLPAMVPSQLVCTASFCKYHIFRINIQYNR
jgi:hypothetical protein